jgi:phage-related protein
MDSFPSIPNPTTMDAAPKWRTLTANFGDGYEQFAPDGINTKETTFTLNWDILNTSDFDTLQTFLDTQTPVNAFNWTNPQTGNVETVRFLLDGFSYTRTNVTYAKVNLKLKTAYGY